MRVHSTILGTCHIIYTFYVAISILDLIKWALIFRSGLVRGSKIHVPARPFNLVLPFETKDVFSVYGVRLMFLKND
jgi:hypothetical protein